MPQGHNSRFKMIKVMKIMKMMKMTKLMKMMKMMKAYFHFDKIYEHGGTLSHLSIIDDDVVGNMPW